MSHWMTSGRARLKARQNRTFSQRAMQRAKVINSHVFDVDERPILTQQNHQLEGRPGNQALSSKIREGKALYGATLSSFFYRDPVRLISLAFPSPRSGKFSLARDRGIVVPIDKENNYLRTQDDPFGKLVHDGADSDEKEGRAFSPRKIRDPNSHRYSTWQKNRLRLRTCPNETPNRSPLKGRKRCTYQPTTHFCHSRSDADHPNEVMRTSTLFDPYYRSTSMNQTKSNQGQGLRNGTMRGTPIRPVQSGPIGTRSYCSRDVNHLARSPTSLERFDCDLNGAGTRPHACYDQGRKFSTPQPLSPVPSLCRIANRDLQRADGASSAIDSHLFISLDSVDDITKLSAADDFLIFDEPKEVSQEQASFLDPPALASTMNKKDDDYFLDHSSAPFETKIFDKGETVVIDEEFVIPIATLECSRGLFCAKPGGVKSTQMPQRSQFGKDEGVGISPPNELQIRPASLFRTASVMSDISVHTAGRLRDERLEADTISQVSFKRTHPNCFFRDEQRSVRGADQGSLEEEAEWGLPPAKRPRARREHIAASFQPDNGQNYLFDRNLAQKGSLPAHSGIFRRTTPALSVKNSSDESTFEALRCFERESRPQGKSVWERFESV